MWHWITRPIDVTLLKATVRMGGPEMTWLIVLLTLLIVSIAALRWGVDSRDCRDWHENQRGFGP